MTFAGFPSEALEFYEGLEADNSKTYWTANKQVYEEKVRAPMEALLEELAPRFGEGKIYRPYRDVRFSANKEPYKTSIAASVEAGGYIQLTAQGLMAGCGMYVMAADQLGRYRAAVDAEKPGAALGATIESLAGQGVTAGGHEVLKSAPRGYRKDHPRIELLRYKGLVAWVDWPAGSWLGGHEPVERVAGFFDACRPLEAWLSTHVGPSELPERERR
jgi:uncharacterized protein (TIGR02453 family)